MTEACTVALISTLAEDTYTLQTHSRLRRTTASFSCIAVITHTTASSMALYKTYYYLLLYRSLTNIGVYTMARHTGIEHGAV
jgi:hypothetical protein